AIAKDQISTVAIASTSLRGFASSCLRRRYLSATRQPRTPKRRHSVIWSRTRIALASDGPQRMRGRESTRPRIASTQECVSLTSVPPAAQYGNGDPTAGQVL